MMHIPDCFQPPAVLHCISGTLLSLVLLATPAAVLAGGGHSHGNEFEGGTEASQTASSIQINVETAKQMEIKVEPVKRQQLAIGIKTTGQIETLPSQKVEVSTPISDAIEPGAIVKASQPVAVLSSPDLVELRVESQEKLAEGKADLQQAQTNLKLAQQNYERQRQIAAADIEQARTEVQVAQEQYDRDLDLVNAGAIPRREMLESRSHLAEGKAELAKAMSRREVLDAVAELQRAQSDVGQKIPLAQVAKIDYSTGPNTINRENVSRFIVVSSNVAGRDSGSAIKDIRDRVKQQVQLPPGYYIEYGGQFEAKEGATKTLIWAGALAFVAIAILLYFAVKSIPATLIILINLPLALIGGVISIALTGGIISVASMVGFITLFGVAARNGLLLVDNYNNKLAAGMPLKEVLIEGSMERLVAILMRELSSALGMVPLVIGSGAGKEILQPLAVVVLGGLFTSTALTLVVLPALYTLFGKILVPKKTAQGFHSKAVEGLSF